MNEQEGIEKTLRLDICDSFPYERIKQVADAIVKLGFYCEIADNGNFVFIDKQNKKVKN